MIKSKQNITSPLFIVGVLILFINDFYLKQLYGNFLTGKLSDIAGLFVFPIFLTYFMPNHKTKIFITTALGFIFWKLPVADYFISTFNTFSFYQIQRTIDYTDYFTLLILPFSYFYNSKVKLLKNNVTIRVGILILSFFCFCSTAGTYGNIKLYEFPISREELRIALNKTFEKYPEINLPEDAIYKNNANSTKCYIEYKNEIFVFGFDTIDNEEAIFNPNKSTLALVYTGYYGENLKLDKDLWFFEKRKFTKVFEATFLTKLNSCIEE